MWQPFGSQPPPPLHTGQRRGDVIHMDRQHVRNGKIRIVQHKTGASLTIPVHPELQAVLDKHTCDHLTLLTTARGEPFTAAGFGNWFRNSCDAAGLPKACSAHRTPQSRVQTAR